VKKGKLKRAILLMEINPSGVWGKKKTRKGENGEGKCKKGGAGLTREMETPLKEERELPISKSETGCIKRKKKGN